MIWKENIEKQLQDEKNKVVTIDLEKAEVYYTDDIKKWEDPKALRGDEEIVRAHLINRLINQLDYRPENIEIETRYDIGRPKAAKAEIDIIVRDKKGNAFLFIECKAPDKFESDKKYIEGQLFKLAPNEKGVKYLVYYTVDVVDGKLVDKSIIIDYSKYKDFHDWQNDGEHSISDEIQGGYGIPKKQPFVKGKKDLSKDLNPDAIRQLARNLHNYLWGGGSTSDTEIFNSLVNVILAKIYDEDVRRDGEEYHFQVKSYVKANGDVITEEPEKLFTRINQLYRDALRLKLNIEDEKKLKKIYIVNEEKFPINKLIYAVQQLESLSFLEGRSLIDGKDILGDFFEIITREGFKQNKGQFFTPTNIVRFLLYALQLDKLSLDLLNKKLCLPYIIDPSCGSGTFLIEAMKLITKDVKRKQYHSIDSSNQVQRTLQRYFYPDLDENQWAKDFLYGADMNFDLGTAAKVNMILHGDGSANLFVQDGLLPFTMYKKTAGGSNVLIVQEPEPVYGNKPENGQFDVVISNPPFNVDLDNVTRQKISTSFLFHNKKNSENMFIERYYQLLKENGRLGVVLPESVYDTTENKYIRLFLYKYFKIKSVVSLPQLSFEPYTSTKTSLLFAQKKTKLEVKKWTEKWEAYGKEWAELKTRVEDYIKVLIDGKEQKSYPSVKEHKEQKMKENILRFLKDYVTPDDDQLSPKELLEKYPEEIKEVVKYDNDTKNIFGYFNTWWVFGEVSKHFDYPIFMAEAENVGYKRTKRGEKPMPNDLFDIEVAPTFINRDAVIDAYQEQITYYENLKKELKVELTGIKKKANGSPNKTQQKDIEKREEDIKGCDRLVKMLTKDKAEAEKIINNYYQNGKGEWQIKDKYHDRTDEKLLEHFTNGLLKKYRSEDVLLRKEKEIKILDAFRKQVNWE
jgi:type I restriction enzyme M protein